MKHSVCDLNNVWIYTVVYYVGKMDTRRDPWITSSAAAAILLLLQLLLLQLVVHFAFSLFCGGRSLLLCGSFFLSRIYRQI